MSYEHLTGLRQKAAGQDGQFATPQARSLGVGRHDINTMRKGGEIENRRLGVWRYTAAPGDPDPAVTAMLACWPNGVISHSSAAVFHGLTRVKLPLEADVTIPQGEVRRLPGISLHWTRSLEDCDVLWVGNTPYTALPRTVIDLADPKDP